jgi:hypothetical protein
MIVKLLEVRDRKTFVPVYAISTQPSNEGQGYLLRRCGFAYGGQIIVARLNGGGKSTCAPYEWGDRTMQAAHLYIEQNFHALSDGDVVDVEFILGETSEPKISERVFVYA